MILDTNAVSALADGSPELEAAAADAAELALPVVVLGEFRYGIWQSRHRARYEDWLGRLADACRVLSVTEATAVEYARLREELRRRGRPIPSNDAWIAALAREHRLSVLSRDAHFDLVPGLRRVSW